MLRPKLTRFAKLSDAAGGDARPGEAVRDERGLGRMGRVLLVVVANDEIPVGLSAGGLLLFGVGDVELQERPASSSIARFWLRVCGGVKGFQMRLRCPS